jgi:hypothetical protein
LCMHIITIRGCTDHIHYLQNVKRSFSLPGHFCIKYLLPELVCLCFRTSLHCFFLEISAICNFKRTTALAAVILFSLKQQVRMLVWHELINFKKVHIKCTLRQSQTQGEVWAWASSFYSLWKEKNLQSDRSTKFSCTNESEKDWRS